MNGNEPSVKYLFGSRGHSLWCPIRLQFYGWAMNVIDIWKSLLGGGGESPPSPILWSWEKEEERETKKNTGTTQRANEPNNLRNTTYVPVILNYAPRDIPIPASIFCEWQRKWHWDGQEKNIIRYDIHKAFHNAIDKYVHTKKKPETKFQSQIPSLETIKISRRLSPQRFIYDDDLRTFLQIPLNRTGIN